MHNIIINVKGDKLVIEVGLGADAVAAAPPSSTGKTKLLASTAGAIAVDSKAAPGLKIAVNVMIPNT